MPLSHNGESFQPVSVDQHTDDISLKSIVESARLGITDRNRLEAALLRIAEDEQRKAGRDIHDDLCSQLSGIGCLTKMLESQLRSDQQREARLLETITEMVASAGQTAREIAGELVPSVLESHGLVGALRELAERQQRRYGMNCALTLGNTQPIEALEALVGTQIYRIAQEAVSNAIRHSDADRILIKLSADHESIDFSVSDDGKGMVKGLVFVGSGLTTMKRRAELINAAFSIQASLGAGATIHCLIPLSH